MRFEPLIEQSALRASTDAFVEFVGANVWWARADQLMTDAKASPMLHRVVWDYHWLEIAISHQVELLRDTSVESPPLDSRAYAALLFASDIVQLAGQLSERGRANLHGRLRDGLKRGFAGLYLETSIFRELLLEGFDVDPIDLEDLQQFDFLATRNGVKVQLECKSLSADAGRKIHRRDFYRFMARLDLEVFSAPRGEMCAIEVEISDRLPSATSQQDSLLAAIHEVATSTTSTIRGEGFFVSRKPLRFTLHAYQAAERPHDLVSEHYGKNCHIAGALSPTGGCVVIMRSEREDDHSRLHIEALKSAMDQLPPDTASIIALQFDDIEPRDLTLPHLRRRTALLDNYIFHHERGQHIAAIYHAPFDGVHVGRGGYAKPAFVCPNPRWTADLRELPFCRGVSNSEFAQRLGVDPAKTDPDGFLYGLHL